MRKLIIILVLITTSINWLLAQSNDECLGCHNDKELTMEKNRRTRSLYVNPVIFNNSMHGKQQCIKCHVGFDINNIPHKANITPVNCQNCHKDASSKHFFHPQMGKANALTGSIDVNCKNCHGTHNVESPNSMNAKFHFSNLAESCGNCHKKERAEHIGSVHFLEQVKNNRNTPNCIFCHQKPITKGAKLSESQLKINQQNLCLSCHIKESTTKSEFAKTLINFNKSVHGSAILRGNQDAPNCIDCHGTHNLKRASDPNSKINKMNVAKVCGNCHIAVTQEYNNSIHGISLQKGIMEAPSCTHCHGEHAIQQVGAIPDRVFMDNHIKRLTVIENKMVYCIQCHADENMARKFNISTISVAHDWLPNLANHYETVRCIDCHSSYLPPNLSHNILPPDKTVKKCEECHGQNSILMTKLYKHEKKLSKERFGFINGTILSNAYVIGTTRNVVLDSLAGILFGSVIIFVGLHGFMRWYFKKGGKK
jgi:hypothetical protein